MFNRWSQTNNHVMCFCAVVPYFTFKACSLNMTQHKDDITPAVQKLTKAILQQ